MLSEPLELLVADNVADDAELLVELEKGTAPAARLKTHKPVSKVHRLSEDFLHPSILRPHEFTQFFGTVRTDLVRLFAGTSETDLQLTALERFSASQPKAIAKSIIELGRTIDARIDAQLGSNAGYTIFERVDFTTSRMIETDLILTAGLIAPSLNRRLGCIEIAKISEFNTLALSTGTIAASAAVGYQIGYPDPAISTLTLPNNALNSDGLSYWAESVTTTAPLQVPWPGIGSFFYPARDYGTVRNITRGAVAEYTITYPQPTDWSVLSIDPYGDAQMNLIAVLVLKTTPLVLGPGESYIAPGPDVSTGYYLLTEYNSNRVNNMLFLDNQTELVFPPQLNCQQIILAFQQPHATQNVISLPVNKVVNDLLWEQLIGTMPATGLASLPGGNFDLTYQLNPNELLGQLGSAIAADGHGLATKPLTGNHTATCYHYSYGANSIQVTSRAYAGSGTFISRPIPASSNLLRGTIVPDVTIPMTQAQIAPASAWIGVPSLRPSYFTLPLGTITYDMTYSESANWFPVMPLNLTQVAEPYVLPVSASGSVSLTTTIQLRFQAIPNSIVYLGSFDGIGDATVIGAFRAPAASGTSPTVINLGAQLAVPGDYVVVYTPVPSSQEVDFGLLAEAATATTHTVFEKTLPQISTVYQGINLPQEPYFDPSVITSAFEPNGDPNSEYVPLSVQIDNLPISFPNLIDTSGHATTISSFLQDTSHALDLLAAQAVTLEQLTTSDLMPASAVNFQSSHINWDQRPQYLPQFFFRTPVTTNTVVPSIVNTSSGTTTVYTTTSTTIETYIPLPQYDSNGNTLWTVDYTTGSVRFLAVTGTAVTYPAGTIYASYWYDTTTWTPPVIVNRTVFGGDQVALTPFDPTNYPIIEYALVSGHRLIFNLDLPANTQIAVTYDILFNEVRVRASLTRLDPFSESASPRLFGFTFLGSKGNSTSVQPTVQSEIVCGNLELTSYGTFSQLNPATTVPTSGTSLPPQYININWYRIVNAGTTNDTLRAFYKSDNGTTLYLDLNNNRYIEPGNVGLGVNYQVIPGDGSVWFELAPGGEAFLGLTNPSPVPGGIGQEVVNSAVVYSAQTPDFVTSVDWLLTASRASSLTSVAAVTLR